MMSNRFKKVVLTTVVVLSISVAGFGVYKILERYGIVQTLTLAYHLQQQKQISVEDKKIVEQLGKIMLLPVDVAPTIAIVTDIDALKKQQPLFFANTHNGDRLILYPDKAIIFDPASGRIVNVGPVQSAQK